MKKIIKISISLIVLASIVFLGFSVYKKANAKRLAAEKIAFLPAFVFLTDSGQLFSDKGIKEDNSELIINFFNPSCEHCQYMVQQYVKNAAKLKDIHLVMITIAYSASLAKFKVDYHLDSIPNLVLLRDRSFQFEKIFGSSVVPSFFIYKNRKLVKKIIGETKIENLLN